MNKTGFDLQFFAGAGSNVNAADSMVNAYTGASTPRGDANAMEHDLKGRFIPAKKTANNVFDSHSSVIPAANMGRLRENVYSSLTEAAESMLSGKIEAVPLKNAKKVPYKYCDYADICGNRDGAVNRLPDAEKLAEAEDILGKNKKGGSEDALDK